MKIRFERGKALAWHIEALGWMPGTTGKKRKKGRKAWGKGGRKWLVGV